MAEKSSARITVGVVGSGQLGMMLALAGIPLGFRFRFLGPKADSPAAVVAPQITGSYDDPKVLEEFARDLSLITFEFENVPASALRQLEQSAKIYPSPHALETSQDRLSERELFQRVGVPTPRFATASTAAELARAVETIGIPCIVKTRRFGYDGKGQRRIERPTDLDAVFHELNAQPLIVEELIPFERELSLVGARGTSGEIRCYPLVENIHRDGILHITRAPAERVDAGLQATAEGYLRNIFAELDYAGVLTIELFQKGGTLIANETAPRVHNSGHWTIEGAETSQFENHLRAISGLPLGGTAPRGAVAMVNLIGDPPQFGTAELAALAASGDTHLHLYHKSGAPGRKVGHVTIVAPDVATREQRVSEVLRILGI